jgi:SAM-dependent methyltransferase
MSEPPLVWHYGLMADHWAEFNIATPELEFIGQAISKYGEPVLDLACGAGRLLVPLLAAGVDVDGADISPDMIERCRQAVARVGRSATLYCQHMDQLDLPRQYRTIYLCGSFGLAGSRERDLETLRRCRALLVDDGALIFDIDSEYASAESWSQWLPEHGSKLPEPWPTEGSRQIAADGAEHRSYFRAIENNPLEQTYTREVRLEKWENGALVASEEYSLRGNSYLKPEVELMLRVAGFSDIEVRGDWTDMPAAAASQQVVFIART